MTILEELTEADSQLKRSLDAFFSNDEAQVLVLKGDWGVGKTFFWNKYIRACIQDKEHPVLKKVAYSYVSLFGIDSLPDVTEATFHNAEALQSIASVKEFLATEVERKSLARNFSKLSKQIIPKVTNAMKHLPNLESYQPAVSFLQDKMVNNYVVCIDDLERKSKNLTVKEIMGFVDKLANQKQCKIILIFNEGCLLKKDKKEFEDYREKVVDIELTYSPSYEENLTHIFDASSSYYQILLQVTSVFGIKNIRVLRKIKWMLDYFQPKLEGVQAPITNSVIIHIVLFCWSFFNSKEALSLDFLKTRMNRASWGDYFSDKENRDSDEEKQFRGLVTELRLEGLDYDKYIIELLEHGFTDIDGFSSVIGKLSADLNEQDANNQLEQAWDIYAESFEDNLDDFIAAIKSQLVENVGLIKLKQFSDAINILSEFGIDVEDYIKTYTETNKDKLANIDPQRVGWGGNVNQGLLSAVNALYQASELRNIDIIALEISRGGWSPEDIGYLYSLNEDDYFKWMMSSPDDLVTKVRGGFLSFQTTSFSTDKEKYDKILNDVVAALKRIAGSNDLNKKRVSNIYGIDLD